MRLTTPQDECLAYAVTAGRVRVRQHGQDAADAFAIVTIRALVALDLLISDERGAYIPTPQGRHFRARENAAPIVKRKALTRKTQMAYNRVMVNA